MSISAGRSSTEDEDDEMTELFDAHFNRLDLVTKGANGMPILIAKSSAGPGLIAAKTVRKLLDQDRRVPIAKAGRVLSAANENAIRGAVVSLQGVLSSLPAETPSAVAKAKAKADTQTAVYTSDGTLVGLVDPAKINPVTDARDALAQLNPPPAPDPTPADDNMKDAVTDGPGPDNLTPAPADSVGTPVSKAVETRVRKALRAGADPAHLAYREIVAAAQLRRRGPGGQVGRR